ncbi:MAG TPA: hypothetical protein VHA09_05170, partial [Nitrososphaera sp.]|nr:hypothetical protein [Nitrososphaera sp.]
MQSEKTMHVPYIRIDARQQNADKIIAAALNARLELGVGSKIPFVLPKVMTENNMASKRILLFGAGGCGKSRCLFEMLRSRHPHKKICIINPKGLAEGAKSKTGHLSEILDEKEYRDHTIIWDNFPEGLKRRSTRSINLAIKMLGSCRRRVYISLCSRDQFEKTWLDAIMSASTTSWYGFKTLRLRYE